MSSDKAAVGLVGCGNISETYLSKTPLFRGIEITACADLNHEAALAAQQRHGVAAKTLDELYADPTIGTVVNLTVPNAHYEVTARAIDAGKNVYSEKPLATTLADGKKISEQASEKGVVVGCAPDTFLGGAHQLARKAVDDGVIGDVTSATCHVMGPGMEMWHPNPDFFFKPGGGPVMDIGPYYIANLVNVIGPVKRVAAMSNIAWPERTITSEPRSGEKIAVEIPTTYNALLEFHSGVKATLSASWDVWDHRHGNMELYGTEGTLYVPDPNFFGGQVQICERGAQARTLPDDGHPFGVPNEEHQPMGRLANYRTAGLVEMLDAARDNREPRCSLARALHALEVMEAIHESSVQGSFVEVETTCERAERLGPEEAGKLMAK